MSIRRLAQFFLIAAVTALTTACGSATHNDADIAFAQSMVSHHAQAVEMSDLALEEDRGTSPEVRTLAEKIAGAQHGEIEQMNAWLDDWNASESASGHEHGHEGHGDGHGDMEGMLTDEQLTELADATGTDFDQLWLAGMIEHHRGAITMAQTVIDEGQDPDVRELAEAIIAEQESEIAEMTILLETLTP
ncbi:MAG: DUF305 domain-containing protein [Aeromicrobium sp.]|uniref:DUF305 domain-containing protein n=1 Tax=Aeromicrobium sp. TaxID=1871063 RepID=UPI0039E241E7